jgi:hypothetical protein
MKQKPSDMTMAQVGSCKPYPDQLPKQAENRAKVEQSDIAKDLNPAAI